MRKIVLTRGMVALVDADDFDRLARFKWSSNGRYARRYGTMVNGSRVHIFMHRDILGLTDESVDVDHINGDTLDNRKCNLRICSRQQNQRNNKKRRRSSSRFKGVSWNTFARKWNAKIQADDKRIHLGYFTDEGDAARAYDAAVRLYYGEYGRLNFPDDEH